MRNFIGTVAVLGVLTVPALAAPGTDPNPNAGKEGSPPGQQQAADVGAQCGTPGISGAASGAFGYYNHGGIPTMIPDPPRGANGYQTGLNNSAVCGNRQGNLP